MAFDANVSMDERLLKLGGSMAAYATRDPTPSLPFWLFVFKNVRLFFLGSDDFPAEAKRAAALALNAALVGGWPGFEVQQFPLEEIAEAHEAVEERSVFGRGVLSLRAEEP